RPAGSVAGAVRRVRPEAQGRGAVREVPRAARLRAVAVGLAVTGRGRGKGDGGKGKGTAGAARHIGIVGVSAEGAALCYRTICSEAPRVMGEHSHPEVTMHTHPLAAYMRHIRQHDWQGVANLMLSSTRKTAQVGAAFAICPDNTVHQAFALVQPESPIPWLHIGRVVAREAEAR